MLLSQIVDTSGSHCVVMRQDNEARIVLGADSILTLAKRAMAKTMPLAALIEEQGLGEIVDLEAAYAEGRMLAPIVPEEPSRLHLTGTGLTHLGSAATRNAMHQQAGAEENLTDSMKMFRLGLEGGKPQGGKTGVQPEWFYKGNGHALVAPGKPIISPGFALDAGEEPEIAGIYIVSYEGVPHRIGFALANEFSDHVTERQNYLYLAHSKLRPASIGPEILVGDLPAHVEGTSRVIRNGAVLWEKPFVSGEDNMSHTVANLEHHHFKYEIFRKPGDIHVHMFGTATLSFADDIRTQAGDIFEIEAAPFGLPLRNPLTIDTTRPADAPVTVAKL
ncbi:AraD1 family protein [Pelagibacterium sp. H642]|uniref:AraD1 family protein n=1 Tax=Pelagibacterium sp. H642 TaxID=1881069 RepID=UPI002814BB9B|nr:AraD1 family protein [Pelagibacterium sp. H642]WMT91681.1 GguC family protein [Pelagibacterium sp. H642]